MRKAKLLISLTAGIMITTTLTSYAGTWEQDNLSWKYKNDTGSYATGWNWIDRKSYFFESNRKMLVDTTTPDGYNVNKDGAWVVNGVVQTQGGTSTTINYDSQFPLKGYIEPWFVTSPTTGTTSWKWDPLNFVNQSNNLMKYVRDCAIRDKNPLYLTYFSNIDLAAISKVSGYPATGLDGLDQGKVDRLSTEIINFLNSFDWKNATDYEKAVQISKRIRQADYLSEDGSQYAYNCLVDGKTNCNGYTNAAYLLAACVGLPVNGLGAASHIYPVFLVDSVWLAYEPTSKDDYFTIADVYQASYVIAGEAQLTQLGKYCEGTGYEIPTSVDGKFPNITYGIIHGEQAPFIKFK